MVQQSFRVFLARLNGPWHEQALWLYMLIVFGHWSEHLAQLYQVYVLGWLPQEAGGLLGLWYPLLAQSEVLHIAYNGSMWAGLILLLPGMRQASRWWKMALILQSWHLFEHMLLQYQYLTKHFFFNATAQTSIGQLLIPRVELHFLYNLIVFVPLVIAYYHYFNKEPLTHYRMDG